MGWNWVLQAARSDERWRLGRRLLDRALRPGATASYYYRPLLQARAYVLLSRLLVNPDQWEAHVDLLQGELILAITYGYEVHERDDEMLQSARRRNKFAVKKILPGTLLVNEIPLLRHIPEWLPWISYKPLARVGRDLGNQVLYPPIQFVKEGILNGTALPSLALESLQELEKQSTSEPDRDKAEEIIAGALASMYSGQSPLLCLDLGEMTGSATKWFLVAMLLYPEIQKKAQDEIDSVIGRDRLPTFEDRPRLPFIDAVCKEVLRWRPVTPTAVPHAVTKDDIYAGFFIPKGAVVIGNAWAILHDPVMYPEPDIFKPERFLNPDGSLRDDPILISTFGFGKRICPGRHFADATLYIFVASLFSVFDIERGRDGGSKLSDYTSTGNLLR
ncbi:cytochrome P450 [Russula compacta]|nr:cytochrome P450 [Russula compacta]